MFPETHVQKWRKHVLAIEYVHKMMDVSFKKQFWNNNLSDNLSCFNSYAHQERQHCNMCWLVWSMVEGKTETAGISTTDYQNQLTKSTFYKETSAASSTRGQGQNNPDAFIQKQICPNFPHEKNLI